jgi:multiple sugar transport system substrate-binding protein
MQEIELTIFDRGEGGRRIIQSLLDEFERSYNIHVKLQLLNWEAGWSKLLEVALYGNGPDLSEVGSTWVMDFVRMNAASNLSPVEVIRLGTEKDFFPMNWRSGVIPAKNDEGPVTWAIPWTSDVRLAYYRRDLFEKANLDPTHAFEHVDSLPTVLDALKSKENRLPLALSTQRSRINLHLMASWLWDKGGDFLTGDGNKVAFDSPEALRGMRQYFQLGEHIPATRRKMDDLEADNLFISGDAAMVFSGWWILTNTSIPTGLRENISMTAMPGASFVGGTHLLAWKHSRKREQAFLLADFMVKHSAEHNIFPAYSLPAYIPAWKKIQFIPEPHFSVVMNALQKGRSFPIGQLWGLVEKRLTDALPIVWERVLDSDENDVEKILAEMLVPLARRINITLE